jgi:hypothetical protein
MQTSPSFALECIAKRSIQAIFFTTYISGRVLRQNNTFPQERQRFSNQRPKIPIRCNDAQNGIIHGNCISNKT